MPTSNDRARTATAPRQATTGHAATRQATTRQSTAARQQEARKARSNGDQTPSIGGLPDQSREQLFDLLQERLGALLDLQLTLKHIHWNVVGVAFIAVHEMLDPQVDEVREMSDAVAERLATLGGAPVGTPGFVVSKRTWDDYEIGRAPTVQHLSALDDVYTGVITDHRRAIERTEDLDPVTQDLFIQQTARLELFQWFVRAHLQDSHGNVVFRESEHS
jgi:starvation-inducible DNA-binding protein